MGLDEQMGEIFRKSAERIPVRSGRGLVNFGSRTRPDLVRIEAIHEFDTLVRELRGNPDELLSRVGIRPRKLQETDALIPYRSMISLLDLASRELDCPDFGLRLAVRQHPHGIMGPVDIAMRNSQTLGDAFRYYAEHSHVYCAGVILNLLYDTHHRWLLQWQILLDNIMNEAQAAEHAQLVTYLAILSMSGNLANVQEAWFKHEPRCDVANYEKFFNIPVFFGQPFTALVLDREDVDLPLPGRDSKVYGIATKLLDIEFPAPDEPLKVKVRRLVEEKLPAGGQLIRIVADELAMHPRTMQRKLSEEDTSFERIKEEVRQQSAWSYLTLTDLPLTTIAALVGYSEHSAFCRSCTRWFGSSPRAIRTAASARSGETASPPVFTET